jgi:hypothetical protein
MNQVNKCKDGKTVFLILKKLCIKINSLHKMKQQRGKYIKNEKNGREPPPPAQPVRHRAEASAVNLGIRNKQDITVPPGTCRDRACPVSTSPAMTGRARARRTDFIRSGLSERNFLFFFPFLFCLLKKCNIFAAG